MDEGWKSDLWFVVTEGSRFRVKGSRLNDRSWSRVNE